MKTTIFTLITLLLISCTKENADHTQTVSSQNQSGINYTSSIPLNDLGTRTYKGDTGGLYPGGINIPTGQYATDLLNVSNSITPLDTNGNPTKKGKIVFISLGASTGGHNMKLLKTKTEGDSATNPKLLLLSCNKGAGTASLENIMDPRDPYWEHVNRIITNQSSYKQVQIIYLETDDSSITVWPDKAEKVETDMDSCLRVFKKKFKNIKVVYVLGRTKTFGDVKLWNKEPAPYYYGWGCKWAIADQINGVKGTAYKGKKAVAPMVTWGFYEWADSLPRKTDGFYWRSYETVDGLHATDTGQDTLTTRFQNFLLTDTYASIWYARH